MAPRIVRVSQTTTHAPAFQKTGMFRAPAVRTMLVRIMLGQTMPVQTMPPRTMAAQIIMLPAVPIRMLLGPELLITALLLRKLATLPGTMVVQPRRKIATFLHPTITMFPVRHLPLRPSSSLVSTLGRDRRTIVRRSRKRVPKITVLRKLRRQGQKIIVRRKLRRRGLNSQRARQRPGNNLLRNRDRTCNAIRRLRRPG